MHLKKLLKLRDAQALVEMALVLPILLMLFLGIFEFGNIIGSYMVINNLVREGVRYGVVGHSDSEIQNIILSRDAWLKDENIEITITPSFANRVEGSSLAVGINYSVNLLTPFFSEILPDPVPISAQCLMRIE